ncbi:MAG: hypothetical protein PHT37_03190 [Candidatus Cloacimonetes bacterium]|jgi:hypothetical protein|nr:YjbH domain-containing protein [Candidatus Cloacimonadota bacterium]MDD2422731.1 hypothetical protein [Candidatus Cloacimonadota bacterium]MDD3562881.1 hypothetical protein [Candidatus Cloacimonadota bacterium]MDD4276879.1 hypothetical protein [Candidatus Cloacimonadota bacterium]MDY0324565.1 hypothetical protein [Candidatus Cloacimonadaceae bacterium]
MKKVILSVIVVVAMFGLLDAAPFQTLGMLRTPDAYVLPHMAAEFMLVGYYRDVAKPFEYEGFTPYMMAGVGIMDRVELGLFVGDKVKDEPLMYFLNLKAKILRETLLLPQVTVGVDNILSPLGKTSIADLEPGDDFYYHPSKAAYEILSPYIVTSKQAVLAGMPFMFNMGVGAHRFTGQVTRSRIFNGVFASVELSPLRDLAIQGEYDGHEFNAGIKYSWKNWGVKVGAQALEDLIKENGYEDNLQVAFGISYVLDKYSEAKRRPDLSLYAKDGHLDEPYIVDLGTVTDENGVIIPPTGSGSQVVLIPPTGSGPSTTLETPGLTGSGTISSQAQLSPEVRDLLEELRALRAEREKAQKSLDDLRIWIDQLKSKKN